MTWSLDTAVVAAVVGLATGALVPALIARVPEPEPDPEAPAEAIRAAEDEADFARPLDDPKDLYVDVAALPGLRWKAALACGLAAAGLGGRVGWHPALLFLLFLVPVCVALAVVDWRTRFLPTYLIAPSYAVVAVLVLLSAALTRDLASLELAAIGWLATFVFFFVQWFVFPRGLGYGDVRLSGLLGMALGWLGLPQLVLGVFTGFLLGGLGGGLLSALKVFHRKHYPFGPFMVVGAWLGAVFPAQLVTGFGAVTGAVAGLFVH